MAVNATLTGETGATATASDRFQVGGCDKLKFKPKLALRLFGGTPRTAHPAPGRQGHLPPGGGLRQHRRGLGRAARTRSSSTQSHIRRSAPACSSPLDACPKGSIYGEAESNQPAGRLHAQRPGLPALLLHPLPDLVDGAQGPDSQPIEVDLVGRIDSVNGGIRTTFATVPDPPVSSFTLKMRGGKKSLLVNSRNLCKGNKATVRMQRPKRQGAIPQPGVESEVRWKAERAAGASPPLRPAPG